MSSKRTTKEGRAMTRLSNYAQLKKMNTKVANLESIAHKQELRIRNLEHIIGYFTTIHEIEEDDKAAEVLTDEQINDLPKEDDEEE